MQPQTEIIPPRESAAVKAFDKELAPLFQRQTALETKVSEYMSALNPYGGTPTPNERAVVEARLSLPQAQADLARADLDISDLNRQRDEAVKAAAAKAVEQINSRIGEKVMEMRRLLEPVIPVNREIYELQLMQEQFLGIPITNLDSLFLRELFREDGDETWWGGWCRTIADRFGV